MLNSLERTTIRLLTRYSILTKSRLYEPSKTGGRKLNVSEYNIKVQETSVRWYIKKATETQLLEVIYATSPEENVTSVTTI